MSSDDILCKYFGPRPDPILRLACSGSNLFGHSDGIPEVKLYFEKKKLFFLKAQTATKKHTKLSKMQRIKK